MSVTEKLIERFAEKNEIEIIKILENKFLLKKEDTFVHILINNNKKDEWITFYRIVAREAEPSSKLMEELLGMNADIPRGAFGLKDDNIIFNHCVPGGHHLDEAEFLYFLHAISSIADEIICIYNSTTKRDLIIKICEKMARI